jgi:PEP-CTERM motif
MKLRGIHKKESIKVRKEVRSFAIIGFPLAGTIAALWLANESAMASITYDVYDTIGQGNVQGSITTDGTLGVLSTGDITGWDLTLNGVGASFVLNNGNSGVLVSGADLTATASDLIFNYSGTDNGLVAFQTTFYTGDNYWCNATAAGNCYQGATVSPKSIFDTSAQHVPTYGAGTIAIESNITYDPMFPPTTETTEIDGDADDIDTLTDAVAINPSSGKSKGLYHYTYQLGYVGQQTLLLPIIEPGDIENLTTGCGEVGTATLIGGGTSLAQVFGSQFNAVISCQLPFLSETTGTVFDFSFDSVFAPTEVELGLEDAYGSVNLVDPPAPNSIAVPEPSTWALMLIGFGGLGFAAYRRSRPAISLA